MSLPVFGRPALAAGRRGARTRLRAAALLAAFVAALFGALSDVSALPAHVTPEDYKSVGKDKGLTLVLAIFFGTLGAHQIYLEQYSCAVRDFLLCILTGGIWWLIQCIRVFFDDITIEAAKDIVA
eukprot:TRINITY_DN24901_c0_g1_i1.p1 TRINITY_DN24901_c0_g1~~TRINITY_DN24901_c0_g1_i1.p1  ORF type:complete len:125 (-),score=22.50 TRINITY_DN24901_c0_g1_i1:422-796(-)